MFCEFDGLFLSTVRQVKIFQYLQCESKKIPPEVFWHFFLNGREFLFQILHTYYTFLSMLEYKFLFNYLQLWRSLGKMSENLRRRFFWLTLYIDCHSPRIGRIQHRNLHLHLLTWPAAGKIRLPLDKKKHTKNSNLRLSFSTFYTNRTAIVNKKSLNKEIV